MNLTLQKAVAREEVLANLANFAYDPINYEWLRKLKIIDIFLNQLSEGTPTLCSFAVSGLCNLSLDQENKSYIIKNDGVALIRGCLSSPEESTVISAIVTLMFLVTPQSKADITGTEVVQQILVKANGDNPRIRNVAKIFLNDYCTPEQVLKAETMS
ncbi:armadillo repeat-containing protein 7-like isoform X2 [Homarus americanus]|uniref:armadillo repeat-containing protein 7-like isoform X2 n=1 Tax=Homarus americanus TaxID=6706 RepID=UPI001C44D415|nr:armadillo repeat-containing protein 7-like isoform X2 [Homarus americanus]